jgi:SAM-dependent methyltransferase
MSESNVAQRERWDEQVGPKWVRIADEMERRLAPVSALLLARAAPAPGEGVLDVGCGPGGTTASLAEAVGERGRVVGVDISKTMLAVARETLSPRIELLCADAQGHAFGPPPFDLVVSRFGVMFFADPVVAFRNLRRAMRSGGRLCFAAWATLDENPHWQIPLGIAMRHVGRPEAKDPRAPGPMSLSDEGYVRGILAAAGFGDARVAREPVGLPGGSASQEAEFATMMGPMASLLDERPPGEAVRAAIVREVADAFRPYERDGACALPATVLLVTASA